MKEMMELRLYGIISEILLDGEFSIGEPIFIERDGLKKQFYKLVNQPNENTDKKRYASYPIPVEKVDISKYGEQIVLPASKKIIGNGKKYLVVFQSNKHRMKKEKQKDHVYLSMCKDRTILKEAVVAYVNVGMKFPNRLMVVVSQDKIVDPKKFNKYFK